MLKRLKWVLFSFLIVSRIEGREGYVNLESSPQNFIVDKKQITLPGHPYAFNPSIAMWKGRLLMSFREILPHGKLIPKLGSCIDYSYIGIVWLDEDFTPTMAPQLFVCEENKLLAPTFRTEDSRLITIDDRLFLIYSDSRYEQEQEACRVYIAELHWDGDKFSFLSNQCMREFEGEIKKRMEKNWVSFVYEGTLLLAYSINPHKIFFPFLDEERCELFCFSEKKIGWPWGELRGGSPALLDDDHYIAFFHSSQEMASRHTEGRNELHYFMGAYLFSSVPPFEITHISPEPIFCSGFYEGEAYDPYWKPVRVVFPCGIVMDKQYIWVSYGRQDHECWVIKIDKKKLIESMSRVS